MMSTKGIKPRAIPRRVPGAIGSKDSESKDPTPESKGNRSQSSTKPSTSGRTARSAPCKQTAPQIAAVQHGQKKKTATPPIPGGQKSSVQGSNANTRADVRTKTAGKKTPPTTDTSSFRKRKKYVSLGGNTTKPRGMTSLESNENTKKNDKEIHELKLLYSEEKAKSESFMKTNEDLHALLDTKTDQCLTFQDRLHALESEISHCRDALSRSGIDPVTKMPVIINSSTLDYNKDNTESKIAAISKLLERQLTDQESLLHLCEQEL